MYNWKHLWWNPVNKTFAGLIGAALMLLLAGCQGSDSKGDPLMDILDSKDSAISRVMQNPGDYEIQIRYTRIARTGDSEGEYRIYLGYRLFKPLPLLHGYVWYP
jgi:hypothetical protein